MCACFSVYIITHIYMLYVVCVCMSVALIPRYRTAPVSPSCLFRSERDVEVLELTFASINQWR